MRLLTERLLMFCSISAIVLLSLWLVRPPVVVPEDVAATQFSSGRAMEHVRAIAMQPHSVGTPGNDHVREYVVGELVKLGLEVQLQQVPSYDLWAQRSVVLQNIVGRLKGTDNSRAIALVCHYDSVPAGPGAGDDSTGVAAILESLRAVRAGAPLRNDLIVLITDGEEIGLLGAQAFVNGHPWLADIELVFNFEARGNGGPALLMQTGPQGGWLIREFARVSPHPFGSSFAEDVFKHMPNDTDFTIFRNAGKTGLNYAFFKGLRYYHSDHDTVSNLDERSLQHHGSNCLALTHHFGNLNLENTRDRDVVFFNLIGSLFVWYPIAWVMPISILAATVFLIVVTIGYRRGRISLWGLAGGLLIQILFMVAASAAVAGTWALVSRLEAVRSNTENGDFAGSDFVFITVAAVLIVGFVAVHAWTAKWIGIVNRTSGALVVWLALTIASCLGVPRGNYFFAWSLLSSCAGLYVLVGADDLSQPSRWRVLCLCASCLPGMLLMTPGVYLIAITVGTSLLWLVALFVALQLGLVVPQLHFIAGLRRRTRIGNLLG